MSLALPLSFPIPPARGSLGAHVGQNAGPFPRLLQTPVTPVHENPALQKQKSFPVDTKQLLIAASCLGVGLLLKALPKRGLQTAAIMSSDWKDYAKIILGVLATSHLNKALNLHPKPWQIGLETSAMIHPLVVNWGNSFFGRFIPIGLVVPAIIEGGSRLNEWVTHKAEKRWGTPPWASGLGVSAVMMLVGMGVYPIVFKLLSKSGLLGKALKYEASQVGWTLSTMLVCHRLCCQGSAICLTELGEIMGSMANWWRGDAKHHAHAPVSQSVSPFKNLVKLQEPAR